MMGGDRLGPCDACGHQVSRRSSKCPQCGEPYPVEVHFPQFLDILVKLLVLVLLLMALWKYVT